MLTVERKKESPAAGLAPEIAAEKVPTNHSEYRFTTVIGPVRVYASPELGVDKILSFVYSPTGAICETGICSACTISYLNYVVDMKVDDTIGWKGHFRRNRSGHTKQLPEKNGLRRAGNSTN